MILNPLQKLNHVFQMKIMNKDLLNMKFDNKKKSYWINRDKTKTTMKQQF